MKIIFYVFLAVRFSVRSFKSFEWLLAAGKAFAWNPLPCLLSSNDVALVSTVAARNYGQTMKFRVLNIFFSHFWLSSTQHTFTRLLNIKLTISLLICKMYRSKIFFWSLFCIFSPFSHFTSSLFSFSDAILVLHVVAFGLFTTYDLFTICALWAELEMQLVFAFAIFFCKFYILYFLTVHWQLVAVANFMYLECLHNFTFQIFFCWKKNSLMKFFTELFSDNFQL